MLARPTRPLYRCTSRHDQALDGPAPGRGRPLAAKRKSPTDRKMKVMTTSNHRPLDPRKCNIAVDANALDRDGTARDRLVDQFNELSSGRRIRAVVGRGVRSEIQHPRTPDHVKAAVLPQIFNLRPGLNAPQEAARHRVQAILQGNAKPGRHAIGGEAPRRRTHSFSRHESQGGRSGPRHLEPSSAPSRA